MSNAFKYDMRKLKKDIRDDGKNSRNRKDGKPTKELDLLACSAQFRLRTEISRWKKRKESVRCC